jgi:hypothetical protein
MGRRFLNQICAQNDMRIMNWTCRGVPVPMGVVFTVDWMIAN